jgi:hypothetical protein
MKKILKKFDRFAISPSLNIASKDRYQTYSGGIVSILVFGLAILTTANFSQNLLLKKNPNIVASQSNFALIPKFNLSDFKIGYFFNSPTQGKVLDPTVLTFFSGFFRSIISLDGTQSVEDRSIGLEKCSLEYYAPFDDKDILKRLNMANNFCFSDKDRGNLQLEGGWGQSPFEMIYVDISICRNSTANGYKIFIGMLNFL